MNTLITESHLCFPLTKKSGVRPVEFFWLSIVVHQDPVLSLKLPPDLYKSGFLWYSRLLTWNKVSLFTWGHDAVLFRGWTIGLITLSWRHSKQRCYFLISPFLWMLSEILSIKNLKQQNIQPQPSPGKNIICLSKKISFYTRLSYQV